jgi:hypothetical protein
MEVFSSERAAFAMWERRQRLFSVQIVMKKTARAL